MTSQNTDLSSWDTLYTVILCLQLGMRGAVNILFTTKFNYD
jgi:hypothetical protein